MIHHLCDVAYDEEKRGPARICKYRDENFSVSSLFDESYLPISA